MNQVDLVISGGMLVDPERIVANSIAVDGGKIAAIGPAEADAAGERAHRRRAACTSCPAPSTCTCTSASQASPTRKPGPARRRPRRSVASPRCSTCRTPIRRPRTSRRCCRSSKSRSGRPSSISASTATSASTTLDQLKAMARGRRGVVQALHGQRESPGAVPARRRDPRRVRNPGRARHPLHRACREHADPDLARRAADQVAAAPMQRRISSTTATSQPSRP